MGKKVIGSDNPVRISFALTEEDLGALPWNSKECWFRFLTLSALSTSRIFLLRRNKKESISYAACTVSRRTFIPLLCFALEFPFLYQIIRYLSTYPLGTNAGKKLNMDLKWHSKHTNVRINQNIKSWLYCLNLFGTLFKLEQMCRFDSRPYWFFAGSGSCCKHYF